MEVAGFKLCNLQSSVAGRLLIATLHCHVSVDTATIWTRSDDNPHGKNSQNE